MEKAENRNTEGRTTLRLGGLGGGRVVQAAAAGVALAADRGKCPGFGEGERNHLFHDAQDEVGSGGHRQFFEQAVQMGVYGVFRYAETAGDACFRQIVENALNNLQFALGEIQGAGDFGPGIVIQK